MSHAGHAFTHLSAPPGTEAVSPAGLEGVDKLVFANSKDGYATGGFTPQAHTALTSDGGHSWRVLPGMSNGTLTNVVATDRAFYGLFSKCRADDKGLEHCSYRLGRSPLRTPAWSSVAIPGASDLLSGYISLAAHGGEVWIYINPLKAGSSAFIVKSHNGRAPFSTLAEPHLPSVTACSMYLMSAQVAWLSCETGMMVSWLRTTDGGHHFTHWWETMGTGGDGFDPVSATVAYRYTGEVGPGTPYTLGRTTDGGMTFLAVRRLAISGGGAAQIAFTDADHGYALGSEHLPRNAGGGTNSLLYSADGGLVWHVVLPGGNPGP